MVAKIQFEVNMSIKALFLDDQREVKNTLREKSQNIEKQMKHSVDRRSGRISLTGRTMAITHQIKTQVKNQ